MKRAFYLFVFCCICALAWAQSNVSNTISVNIQKEVKPAILEIVEGSIRFVDPSGNNAIDANETCRILFAVKNTGVGDGYNCVARIKGIYYNLDSSNKTAEVTSCYNIYNSNEKYSGDITIPSTISHKDATYNVTSIGIGAFRDCSSLTSIIILNSVISIREDAF